MASNLTAGRPAGCEERACWHRWLGLWKSSWERTRSHLPEEPCACCSWTILTPKNVSSHQHPSCPDPGAARPPPPAFRGTRTVNRTRWSGIWEPLAQHVKINRAAVQICECDCGSDEHAADGKRTTGTIDEGTGTGGLASIKLQFHSVSLMEWNKTDDNFDSWRHWCLTKTCRRGPLLCLFFITNTKKILQCCLSGKSISSFKQRRYVENWL